MSKYTATGKLHEIFDEQRVSEKFTKRDFVLEIIDGQYPEHVRFQLVQDKIDFLDRFKVGDSIEVSFNLRGKGFRKNGMTLYFTNLDAWKIEAAGQAAQAPVSANKNPSLRAQPQAQIASDDDNDLPF